MFSLGTEHIGSPAAEEDKRRRDVRGWRKEKVWPGMILNQVRTGLHAYLFRCGTFGELYLIRFGLLAGEYETIREDKGLQVFTGIMMTDLGL